MSDEEAYFCSRTFAELMQEWNEQPKAPTDKKPDSDPKQEQKPDELQKYEEKTDEF